MAGAAILTACGMPRDIHPAEREVDSGHVVRAQLTLDEIAIGQRSS
jgi:hypothetical protein